ncbi:MAG TPA: type II CAAX endopeptidase family protein [bacterium]|nr:type II CAAX endopeptidase family protein [bacterium]HPM58089.1 type II CAAX endopeptidase family protein [bacterium]
MEPEVDNSLLDARALSRIMLWTLAMFLFSIFFGAVMVFLAGPKAGLLAETLFIIPALLFVYRRRMPFARTFRFNPVSPQILFYTLLLALPVMILGDELDRLIAIFFPLPSWFDVGDLMSIHSLSDGFLIIGNGVIVAAIAEEMLFRGLIQRSLERMHDIATAIALSAIIFAMFHFNIWWMIQITLLGLVLGYIAWRSDSIWPAILIHGFNNLLSILAANAAEEKLAWYTSGEHVHWIWLAASLLLLIPAFAGFQKACTARRIPAATDRTIGDDHD